MGMINWKFGRDSVVASTRSEHATAKVGEIARRIEEAQQDADPKRLTKLRDNIESSGLDQGTQETLLETLNEYLEQIFNAKIMQKNTIKDFAVLKQQIQACQLSLTAEERLRVAINARIGHLWWKQLSH